MRIERSTTTVSWIPSDLLEGMGRAATKMKIAHHDDPPPRSLGPDVEATIEALQVNDRFRFTNRLVAHIDVDDHGQVTGWGHDGGGLIGATTVGIGRGSITIPATKLDDIRPDPEASATSVRFVQTVGGRTGSPMPRTVPRPPFVQYVAPIVWTTLELTIHADGRHEAAMTGASAFPRHWVYGDDGELVAKSSAADYKAWMTGSFERRTPWGDEDSPALVTEVESRLEQQLHDDIMRGGAQPRIDRVAAGATVIEQGTVGGDAYLLLNGVLVVEVDGEQIAEIGPGAVFGVRAALEGGLRSSTVRAVTSCKLAAVPATQLDPQSLAQVAREHHREDA